MHRAVSPIAATIPVFPLLAVLLCALGTAVILLVALSRTPQQALAASDSAMPAAADVENEREELDWRIGHLQQSRERTEADLKDARLQLSHLEDHLRRLREQAGRLRAAVIELERDAPSKQQEQATAAVELERLTAEIRAAEQEIANASRIAQNKPVSYSIVPYEGSNHTNRRPIFIECRGDSVVLQPEGIAFTANDFDGPQGPGNPLASALRAIREYVASTQPDLVQKQEPYPLLIVRPDGITAYYLAQAALKSWGSQFGYELVVADWKLKYADADPRLAAVLRDVVAEARIRQEALIAAAPKRYRGQEKPSFHVKPQGGIELDKPSRAAQGRGDNPYRRAAGMSGRRGSGDGFAANGRPGGTAGNRGAGGSGDTGGSGRPGAGYGSGDSSLGQLAAGGSGPGSYAAGGGLGSGSSAAGSLPGGSGGQRFGTGGIAGSQTGGASGGNLAGGGDAKGPGTQAGGGSPLGASGQAGAGTQPGGDANPLGGGDTTQGGPAQGGASGYGQDRAGSQGQPGGDAASAEGAGESSSHPNARAGGSPADRSGNPGVPSARGTSRFANAAPDDSETTTDGQQAAGTGNSATSRGGPAGKGTGNYAGQGTKGSRRTGGANLKMGSAQGEKAGKGAGTSEQFQDSAPDGKSNGSTSGGSSQGGSPGSGGQDAPADPSQANTVSLQPPIFMKRQESLAKSRGRDWGLPEASGKAVAASRPVIVECYANRLVIMADDGKRISKELPLGGNTADAIDDLVAGVQDHMKGWGLAGRGLYWKPTLIMRVQSDGRQRFNDLQSLLSESGYELRESTHAAAAPVAKQPTGPEPRKLFRK